MSRSTDFLPSREADLLAWSVNFNTLINADPTKYGLLLPQATAYTEVHEAYASAYQTAADPATRTPVTIEAKREAKAALKAQARALARIVQAFPGTTDADRVSLGLRVHDREPTPVPPPATAPVVTIVSTLGRIVRIRLRDSVDAVSRGRPHGVAGATVLAYVGEEAPASPMEWSFLFNTSETIVDVEFSASVPPGSRVWLTAFWYNPRSQSGPAAAPVSARIGDGLAQAA